MNQLNRESPFVWPEPSVLTGKCCYKQLPPFNELAKKSKFIFGIVSALTKAGIETLETWLECNQDLKVSLIVVVYPTCATTQENLCRLLEIVGCISPRLNIRVKPLGLITDRATNTLCCLASDTDAVHILTGTSEDFGLAPANDSHANFAFRGDPVLIEDFKRYFDFMWAKSRDITKTGVELMPALVIPEGSEEGAMLWRNYMKQCTIEPEVPTVIVDPDTGEVKIIGHEDEEPASPTEIGGLKKLDQLSVFMANLYGKGKLVSIDKLSRIPPLDAPLSPKIFGDVSERQAGNITRKVSMRVSIIDEDTLKKIKKCSNGISSLLTKFTFSLANNMRWMPDSACPLFESEFKRINEEGKALVSSLLKGDVDAFVEAKSIKLEADINAMHADLGIPGKVPNKVIEDVIDDIKKRLSKAQLADFIPKLSFTVISFSCTDNEMSSPWGQAFSLLADIVEFPRKAETDNFFLNGLTVPEEDLIKAMNVANDALCCDPRPRGLKDRCRKELKLLSQIAEASIDSKKRCELVCRILAGDAIDKIEETLKSENTL